jgi:hypothetical protein
VDRFGIRRRGGVNLPYRVGDRVRIERDETLYPSKGTWPNFRGRAGTIVEINGDHKRPQATEFGVALGKVSPRTDRPGTFNWDASSVAWFKSGASGRGSGIGPSDC